MSIESVPGPIEINNSQRIIEAEIPVLLLAHDPVAKQIYDNFMHDFVGQSSLGGNIPELTRVYPTNGEISYKEPLLSSYSQNGNLVHIRTSSQFESSKPEHFLVSTADLVKGKIDEWWVKDVIHQGKGTSLETKLELSTSPLVENNSNTAVEYTNDPIVNIFRYVQMIKDNPNIDSQAWILLTSKGCWFKPPDKKPESLAPIGELTRKLTAYIPSY